MDQTERAKPKEERLVEVRGARGTARQIEARGFDARVQSDSPGFDGYASTFWMVDSYGTAFEPGCFTKTLQERGARALVLWQHNPDWPIGHPTAMAEDDQGLNISASVNEEVTFGHDALALLRGGTPLGLSIGFRTLRERQATAADPLRFSINTPEWVKRDPTSAYVIQETALYEFSPVSFASNDEALPSVVRSGLEANTLSLLLDDLRHGVLDPARRALVAAIVAATKTAGPDPVGEPPTVEMARHDRARALSVLAATCGLTLEQFTCPA